MRSASYYFRGSSERNFAAWFVNYLHFFCLLIICYDMLSDCVCWGRCGARNCKTSGKIHPSFPMATLGRFSSGCTRFVGHNEHLAFPLLPSNFYIWQGWFPYLMSVGVGKEWDITLKLTIERQRKCEWSHSFKWCLNSQAWQQRVFKQKVFLVGAGALGCEYMKVGWRHKTLCMIPIFADMMDDMASKSLAEIQNGLLVVVRLFIFSEKYNKLQYTWRN